jgi:predicted permease
VSSRLPRPLRPLRALARTLFGGTRQDRELDEELRAYLEQRIDREIARGVPAAEARRRVLAEEGGVEAIKEHTRAARIGFALARSLQDVRVGLRLLRRAPGFSLVACATLAIGIGATLTMFTVMRTVLWRPLPYPDPDRLVVIEVDSRGVRNAGASGAEVRDLQVRSRTLEQIATINAVAAHVVVGDEVDGLAAGNVSDGLLPALGTAPVLGRPLEAARDGGTAAEPSATAVLVSDAWWRGRLGGDPAAIGRKVVVNNVPREIVGVLPAGFGVHLPPSIGAPENIDIWFATGISEDRINRGVNVIARLVPGSSIAQAQRELEVMAATLAAEHPAAYTDGPVRFRVQSVHAAVTENVRPGLTALAWAVAFVLLVSCVNVANLQLARGTARGRELAVRRARGAGRGRIAAQLLIEALVLSTLASVAGLLLARWGVDAIEWLQPAHLPRRSEIALDGGVAFFAIGLTAFVVMLFGLIPALRLSAPDVQPARAGRGDTAGRSARRLQRTLVVAEIALSIVPLVAAGLMLRSFVNLNNTRLGFEPRRVMAAHFPISFRHVGDVPPRLRLHENAFARIRALPGVEAVSAGSPVPFGPLQFTRRYGPSGDRAPASLTTMQSVFPGYFDVMGTRVLEGRDFTRAELDAVARVIVIDARIARSLFPAGAIGQRLALASEARVNEFEVIGVAEPVRMREVRDADTPHVYIPYSVFPVEMTIVARSSRGGEIAVEMRRALQSLGTARAVDVQPLESFVAGSIAETRFVMLLLGAFAISAVLLAGIGLYGTLAYLTGQRSREFGVRLALGATPRQVLALVSRESAALTLAGVLFGGATALLVTTAMARLIYGIAPTDAVTFAGVIAIIGGVSILASIRPAWMASRIDAATVLRQD